jgi:hypothetical protein
LPWVNFSETRGRKPNMNAAVVDVVAMIGSIGKVAKLIPYRNLG